MSAEKTKASQLLASVLEYIRYIHNFEYNQLHTEEDVKNVSNVKKRIYTYT